MPGKLLYIQKDKDLALLKTFREGSPYVRLADTRDLRAGQEVFAIGAPLGNAFSVSNGIISALNRDEIRYNSLQTNAAINPGNSGGPLFNLKGELVGINSFIESPLANAPVFTGLGFSVESGQILEFLASYKSLPNNKSFKLPKYKREMRFRKSHMPPVRKKLRKGVKQYNLPFLQENRP
jgi:S1-C subfamily serine protease